MAKVQDEVLPHFRGGNRFQKANQRSTAIKPDQEPPKLKPSDKGFGNG